MREGGGKIHVAPFFSFLFFKKIKIKKIKNLRNIQNYIVWDCNYRKHVQWISAESFFFFFFLSQAVK